MMADSSYWAVRRVPLIVATALLMENLDSSVLATSLPQIAADISVNPIHLKLALTSYLLSLAVFIPASGWVADRFGARSVFRLAILVFALGSAACGFSQNLPELVAARILQGIGGAMMVPVGRLIVLRAVPKAGLVGALAWLTVPALIGPVLGPPVGGFITTYFQWRWIFWINLPIAALGVILATMFVPDLKGEGRARFDALGFLMLGPGLAALVTGFTLTGLGLAPGYIVAVLMLGGLGLTAGYVRHALARTDPLVDLRLLALPSFRLSIGGGSLFRVGAGATPFLLPLMLQIGFGLTAFQSGMLTFASGAGALFMKFLAERTLGRFGFRWALVFNGALASCFIALPALFWPGMPGSLMIALLFVGGLSRSLQFTALNAIAYSEVPSDRLSSATSFSAVVQQISSSLGISVAALGLESMQKITGSAELTRAIFPPVFVFCGALSALSILAYLRLSSHAGTEMIVRRGPRGTPVPATAVPATAVPAAPVPVEPVEPRA